MENHEQGMEDMELNFIEMALNNPLTSKDEVKRRCKRLLSMGKADTDAYKDNCLAEKAFISAEYIRPYFYFYKL